MNASIDRWIDDYERRYPDESTTVDRFRSLLADHPDCFQRDCWAGHVTGAAWLVSPEYDDVLLTHHRKLDRWLQLGGHSDGDRNPLAVAAREAEEESGLTVVPVGPGLLDIDIHPIPARSREPEHLHFDLRFAFVSASGRDFRVSEESKALAWVPIDRLHEHVNEPSILRMRSKWRRWVDGGSVEPI